MKRALTLSPVGILLADCSAAAMLADRISLNIILRTKMQSGICFEVD